jgi:hypothetical protein
VSDRENKISSEEVEAENAVSLPSKEVMSLLDVNANVDLGLDLAAPVDLAAAANLNVVAPIEASASANVLSPDAHSVSVAQQGGSIDQGISGSADAVAPQHATVSQDSTGTTAGTAAPAEGGATADAAPATDATTAGAGSAVDGATGAVGGAVDGATSGGAAGAVDGATGAVGGATGAVGGAVDGATGAATGGAESLLNGGSLLNADVNIHANANLAAPIDGAVAANANVAAPIDASVAANVGSPNAVSEAEALQSVNISQHLDGVSAHAEATQDASVDQK